MNSLKAARHIQKNMAAHGFCRNIYWDVKHQCFRVMRPDSFSFIKYGNDNFELIKGA